MSESPPHSSEKPQYSDPNPNPNPNPNFDTPENNPPQRSQPLSPDYQNPPPKSPVHAIQKDPDQETHPHELKSHLLVDVDEEKEQEQEQHHQKQQQDYDDLEKAYQEEDEEIEDEEGINMPPSPFPQSSTSKNSKLAVCTVRRTKKRKKGPGNKTTNVVKQRKMQALSEGLKPIPFVPVKVFDFSRHEEDLRRLGLWEFAHVKFDSNVRVDLLVQLIVGYTQRPRISYVNDNRVKLNRGDLARALKLPVKKPTGDSEGENFSSEFISFLDEFVSNWMLLHEECDVWETPNEIVHWLQQIKEGQPQKVDFAGMIWFMMEKELAQGQELKDCFYASHMQLLIKDQRKNLFMETVDLASENQKFVEVTVEDDEEGEDIEMLDAQESSLGEERLQEPCIEHRLDKKCEMAEKKTISDMGQKDVDADMVERVDDVNLGEMDGEVSKLKEVDDIDKEKNVDSMECIYEGEERENIDNVECAENAENSKGMSGDDVMDLPSERNWFLDGGMQRCSMPGLKMSTGDARLDSAVEDEVGEDDEQGFKFMGKSTSTMAEMTSEDLIAFETGNLSYTSVELGGQSSLGLTPSRAENDVMLNGPSLFNHVLKREIDQDHDISHHALDGNQHKRIRLDGHWDHKHPDVGTYLGQIRQLVEKAQMTHDTDKEETHRAANMIQIYDDQIAEKEAEVMQWRFKFDELQRKLHVEVRRRDRELHLMNNVIDGYRKALKDTRRTFFEYRKRCQIPDEPIYKDAGNGGVVKSIMELEKERIKQEEERERNRYLLEHTFDKLFIDHEPQWEVLQNRVMSYENRLTNAAKEVELLKEKRQLSKNATMSEEVQSEAQEVQKDDFETNKMSENVDMLEEAQSKAQVLVKVDLVDGTISDDVAMPEEVQSEAQGS